MPESQWAYRYPSSRAVWKKTRQVIQTAEEPPRTGRICRAAMGSMLKTRRAERNAMAPKSGRDESMMDGRVLRPGRRIPAELPASRDSVNSPWLDVSDAIDRQPVVSCRQSSRLNRISRGEDGTPLAGFVDGVHPVEFLDVFHEDVDLEDLLQR